MGRGCSTSSTLQQEALVKGLLNVHFETHSAFHRCERDWTRYVTDAEMELLFVGPRQLVFTVQHVFEVYEVVEIRIAEVGL